MSAIKLLDSDLINKIAAGEVVERPASVVKELVENAIDAGARAIQTDIQGGGIDLIRVADDGRGIPPADLPTAFLRHATSKIATFDDLTSALTLGFRGEALAAVAGVADVEITTKTPDGDVGAYMRIRHGVALEQNETGAADGTQITVRDLFLNVPARRKFLKSAAAESARVSELIERFALGNPTVSFCHRSGGAVSVRTDGGGLNAAVLNLFGRDAARLINGVSFTKGDFAFTGCVGLPEMSRANRRGLFFYVNGRAIHNKTMEAAVMDAYAGRLTVGRFPFVVLNVALDPALVDCNVHPAKLEVRFRDERALFSAVRDAALSAFGGRPQIPVVGLPRGEAPQPMANPLDDPLEAPTRRYAFHDPLALRHPAPPDEPAPDTPRLSVLPQAEPFRDFNIIGQAFGTYWLVEREGRLFAIDQHAAHERILYERLRARLAEGAVESQRLLVPLAVALDAREKAALAENIPLLERLGYEIEQLDEDAFAVRAVPNIFSAPAKADFLRELLGNLSEGGPASVYDTQIDRVATMSCKAAVKANDRLSYAEARALVSDMMKLEDPFHCPHGRPTVVEISKSSFDKMFLRT